MNENLSNSNISHEEVTSTDNISSSRMSGPEEETTAASESNFSLAGKLSEKEEFSYEPLPYEDDIRLLILEPGEGYDDLVGRLEVSNLSEAHRSFEAISYAWGSDQKNKCMTLEDKKLAITTSLYDALFQTRLPDKRRVLWADAVCINQANDQEKGLQVKSMGQIYRISSCTLIFLGVDRTQNWPYEVATLVRDVNEMMDQVFKQPNGPSDWGEFPRPGAKDPILSDKRWNSWNELLRQPWFKRGWVVQEAALAPDCLVLLAGIEIPWHSILRVNNWADRRSGHLFRVNGVHLKYLRALHSRIYRLRWRKEARTLVELADKARIKEMSALQVLNRARELDLKDPKDRIYAFMDYPTSANKAMPTLQPRYGNDTSFLDVYREFAIKYLDKHSDLSLLNFVDYNKDDEVSDSALGRTRTPSFPSWIPRWDQGASLGEIGPSKHRKLEKMGQELALLDNNSIVRVKGVIFDSVEYVSDVITKKRQPEEAVATIISLWREVAGQSIKHPGPHTCRLSLAFLETANIGMLSGDDLEWRQSLKAFADFLRSDSPDRPIEDYAETLEARLISTAALRSLDYRKFLILTCGYFGISPLASRKGDVCAIIYGTHSPFILREISGKDNHYLVIGPAYIQSAETSHSGRPYELGRNRRCDDWKNRDLPAKDIFLC